MKATVRLYLSCLNSIVWGIVYLSSGCAFATEVEHSQDSVFRHTTPSSHLSEILVESISNEALISTYQLEQTTSELSIPVEESSLYFDSNVHLINSTAQVTSVSQLSDVQPTDWAFQALQSLIERYGCIVGYSEETFLGNQALTRYEFAAGLNMCFDRVNGLITAEASNLATSEDLVMLQRLQVEFAVELTTLQGQVDSLEAQTIQLQSNQFSTTTTLSGEVIFGLTGIFGNQIAATVNSDRSEPLDESVIFNNRTRLRLNTSFTGQDLLRIRLQATNTPNLVEVTGTNMARLGFDGGATDNSFAVNQLFYRFPVGRSSNVTVIASGALFDVVDTLNPLLGSDATGSPFLFGVRSPIYREEIGGMGAGVSYDLSPALNLSLVYLASNVQPSSGLLDSPYSALGQLTWRPSGSATLGFVYSRSYNGIEINAGSANANTPFGNASQNVGANSYGLVGNIRISPDFALGGWTGLVQATAQDLPGNPTADIFYYAITLAFPDVGKEGNLAGIILGQPPRLIRNEFGVEDPDTSFNIEAFYRFQVNGNISITPGFLVVINPEHNGNNDTLYIGTIRTTFMF